MALPRVLKKYRSEYNYTQAMVAELCGVSRQAVAKWESGASTPDADNLIRLSELFNVSLNMLLTGKDVVPAQEPISRSDANQTDNEKLINKGLRQAMTCDDPNCEIQTFIEYIGRMMCCDRVRIIEQDPCGDYCNSYEWCNRGVVSQIEQAQSIPPSHFASWFDTFRRGEYVYVENVEALKVLNPDLYEWLEPQQIQSLLVLPLFDGKGFLSADNPAMAFVSQTATLLELSVHFIEAMVQRRNLVHRLLLETDRSKKTEEAVHRANYYINLVTHSLVISSEEVHPLGFNLNLHCLEDLYQLLENHPECKEHILEDGLERVCATHEAVTVEFVFYTKSRMIRWARLSFRPFVDNMGNLLQIYGTLQDISNEHEIIERYNAFTTHLSGGMHICHLSDPAHLAYASDNLCKLVGYTREEFEETVGASYSTLVADEDLAAFKAFMRRLGENPGTVETIEYGLKHHDGSIIRVIDTMESVLDANGIVYGYANVMDVSELRHALDIAKEKELHDMAELDRQFEIVDALSYDYRNVFLVDLKSGQAVIHKLNGYVTRGMDRTSADPIAYDDFCERYIEERVFPGDQDFMRKVMNLDMVRAKLKENDEYVSSYRILEDGEVHYCQFKYIILDEQEKENGAPVQAIAAFKNIDAIMRQDIERKKAMRLRMDIINAFLEIYLVGYFVNLENDTITDLNFSGESIASHENVVTFLESNVIVSGDKEKRLNKLLLPEAIQKKLSDCDFACDQFKIGNATWCELSLVAQERSEDGQVAQYFVMIRDISAEKLREIKQQEALRVSRRREQEMMETAYRDCLTGVMNRAAYQEAYDAVDANKMLGVIYCDVNKLKAVNDTMGHAAGDQLLCQFADLVKKHFSLDCIFRIGGDEFICLVNGITQESFFTRVGSLTADIWENDGIAALGVAYGLGSEKDALLLSAEQKMYQDKANGK